MAKEIRFPGWSVSGLAASVSELLLVAGGRLPDPMWLKEVAQGRVTLGVDRGFRGLLAAEISTAEVVGDLDSLSSMEVEKLKEMQIPLNEYQKDKDYTDLELALNRGLEFFPETSHLWVAGGFGGRMDHLMGSLRAMASLRSLGKPVYGLVDDKESLLFVGTGEKIKVTFDRLPKIISMIPLSNRLQGAFLQGCHWALAKGDWNNTEMPPISNRLAEGSDAIEFSLTEGLAGIYICWDEENL